MKKKLLLFVSVLLLIVAALFFISRLNNFNTFLNFRPLPEGKTYEVILTENSFSPNEIEIKRGDSIKFSTTLNEPFWPASDLHPTHGIYPEFDLLEPIDPDKSWTFQFLKSGRWKFHDHLQPMFRGLITVR